MAKRKGACLVSIAYQNSWIFFKSDGKVKVNNFKEFTDLVKRFKEPVPRGIGVVLSCGAQCSNDNILAPFLIELTDNGYTQVPFTNRKPYCIRPKTLACSRTDVPEIANEVIMSVKKMRRCGTFAV